MRNCCAFSKTVRGLYSDVGDANKATAAALRARLMGHKQPSMVLGPASPQDSAAELPGASSRAQTVELSAVDSKGRAVPGAFGRAAAGASAPDGGRKPKRVSCSCCQLPGALLYMTILPGRFRLQLATDKLGTSHPHISAGCQKRLTTPTVKIFMAPEKDNL